MTQKSLRKKMAPSDLLLAILICNGSSISTLILVQPAEASMATAALSRCQRRCGDVEIPYPFGIEEECYLDKAFQVTCDESTGSASIPSLHGEVDAISISNHTLRYKKGQVLALQFNKSGESIHGHSFDLSYLGDHYSISHADNKFIALGCDFYAYLVDTGSKGLLGGCASLCNRRDIAPLHSSSCSGLSCCHMNFHKDLRNLTLNVDTINTLTKSWKCGFFTFVDRSFPLNNINISACDVMYTVPVMFRWMVGDGSCDDSACGYNTVCVDSGGEKGYKCKCRDGFTGNPYEGCLDFDECANKEDNNCPMHNACVNTEGGYFCLPNRKHILAMLLTLGIGLGVGLLTLVVFSLWFWRKLKQMNYGKTTQRCFKRNGGLLLQQKISSRSPSGLPEPTLFKIEELNKATDKFSESRVLGRGGLGTVYKGMLSDGRIVAVKKANITDESQISQFINEVFILSQISHRHIVKLLGCCLETEVPLLVCEYIPNGTLSHHIHGEHNIPKISWENRLRVAAEVAGALAYLHFHASTAIFHRDIKSSNILLDENYKAVISDFGLSRSVSIDRNHLTTLVGGTFGYLDPEYFQSGQLNDKCDVYAFGVVLAEMLTGQKAVSSVSDNLGLAFRFRSAMKEHCLSQILEHSVLYKGLDEEILAVAELAKKCLKVSGRRRPSMKEVAAELDRVRKIRERYEASIFSKHHSFSVRYNSGIESEREDG